MDQMEKIETLREKTGCTYTEAKAALEASNGDLLDALCWLEQRGKSMVVGAYSSTAQEPPQEEPKAQKPPEEGAFERGFKALWEGIIALIRRGNRNHLIMQDKQGKQAISLPVTIFVVLLIAAFWVVLPLMVVAAASPSLAPSWGGRISTAPWARPRTLPTTSKRNFIE